MSSATDPVRLAVSLAAELRRAGLPVGIDRCESFVRGAALSGDLYWAGRATLVSRAEDIPVFDRVFAGLVEESELLAAEREQLEEGFGEEGSSDLPDAELEPDRVDASRLETLRQTAFDALTDPEVEALARYLNGLSRRPPRRRQRRPVAARRGRLDLRRTAREIQRLGGEGAELRFTTPSTCPQPLTFVVDVSGSMRAAARALLLACSVFVRASTVNEAFGFGTSLTRVTPVLRQGPLSTALTAAAAVLEDREGGTRIGESLAELLAAHGRGRILRGAIVVIYSDGLETGDPEGLGRQMERLSRLARRVVWLNPLSSSEDYEPLARGMTAALPYVDAFESGESLASFEAAIERALDAMSPFGSGGRR